MNSHDEIEQLIQSKKPTAPRSTPGEIESLIAGIQYVLLPDRRSTLCCIALVNGYTVHGISSVVNAENYDQEVGRITSYKKAYQALKDVCGVLLAEKRYQADQAKKIEAGQGLNQYFEHYTGGIYKLLHRAKTELDLEDTVVYQAVVDGVIYTRPASEFYEKFKCILDMSETDRVRVNLQAEYQDLSRRMQSLEIKLSKGQPENMTDNDYWYAKRQLAPMREYHQVLTARIIDMDQQKQAAQ